MSLDDEYWDASPDEQLMLRYYIRANSMLEDIKHTMMLSGAEPKEITVEETWALAHELKEKDDAISPDGDR